jgi:hypothetical protein
METKTAFIEASDRYVFDFQLCTYERGWAQIDTSQDASYFGTWCSPGERKVLNFAEGDVTIRIFETDEAFAADLRAIDVWNRTNGYGGAWIDPGHDQGMKEIFERLGVADLLH